MGQHLAATFSSLGCGWQRWHLHLWILRYAARLERWVFGCFGVLSLRVVLGAVGVCGPCRCAWTIVMVHKYALLQACMDMYASHSPFLAQSECSSLFVETMPKREPGTNLAGDWEKDEDIRLCARELQAATGFLYNMLVNLLRSDLRQLLTCLHVAGTVVSRMWSVLGEGGRRRRYQRQSLQQRQSSRTCHQQNWKQG